MGNQKGGKKLRRGPKHANMYAAQFHRTARNKASAAARIARRKKEMPNKEARKVEAENAQSSAWRKNHPPDPAQVAVEPSQ